MATLQILCPNGRRQNVKITPNTKLLQVLEDVCTKQKFLPVEDYQLIHSQGRKTLDLTLSVRFSNLPNNAKLELVKAECSRAESEVVIALQLESGERLQHSFSPGTSLFDILEHWDQQSDSEVKYKNRLTHVDMSQSPSVHPVCIYMREEVTGLYALRETKLRTLGLTGGKAVIRLLHRSVDDATLDEIKAKIEKEKIRKSKLEQHASQVQASQPNVSQPTSSTTSSSQAQRSVSIEAQVQTNDESQTAIKAESTTISLNINLNIQNDGKLVTAEQQPSVSDTQPQEEAKEEEPATKTLESCDVGEPMEVEHAGEHVMETEESVSSSTAETKQSTDVQCAGTSASIESLRNLPGIEVFTPDDFNDLPPEQQVIARRLAKSFLANLAAQGLSSTPAISPSQQAIPEKKKSTKRSAEFVDFKFPEATKGKQLYNNEQSSAKEDDFRPCDRKTVVFNIEDRHSPDSTQSTEDLPEEFFDLTERDMRSLMVERQKRLNDLEDQPLMTSAMRQARMEEDYGKYNKVVIRVQFHDKLVIQGMFRPRETVFALQKFVKDHLEDKSLPFYLYTAPPKHVLKDNSQTLLEARLVPATLVYFGCEQQKEHYLSEAVLGEHTSKLRADELVAECLSSVSEEEQGTSDQATYSGKGKAPVKNSRSITGAAGGSALPSTSSNSLPGPSTGRSDKSMPKWFKLGKK